jgi:capsid protein
VLKPYLKTDEAMEKWEAEAERIFGLWAENSDCDITRGQTFTEMQALILRSCLESGDVFVVRKYKGRAQNPFGTALQLVEADHVDNPKKTKQKNVIAGVEVGDDGAPLAYHIFNKNPADLTDGEAKTTKVLAFDEDGRRQVLHIFSRTRPGLTHGIPYLVPVIESLKTA